MSELDDPLLRMLSEADANTISHEELKDLTCKVLNEVLDKDSVLGDLPDGVTLEEVDLQTAVEYGQAITVYLERFDGIVVPIVVSIPTVFIEHNNVYGRRIR